MLHIFHKWKYSKYEKLEWCLHFSAFTKRKCLKCGREEELYRITENRYGAYAQEWLRSDRAEITDKFGNTGKRDD